MLHTTSCLITVAQYARVVVQRSRQRPLTVKYDARCKHTTALTQLTISKADVFFTSPD